MLSVHCFKKAYIRRHTQHLSSSITAEEREREINEGFWWCISLNHYVWIQKNRRVEQKRKKQTINTKRRLDQRKVEQERVEDYILDPSVVITHRKRCFSVTVLNNWWYSFRATLNKNVTRSLPPGFTIPLKEHFECELRLTTYYLSWTTKLHRHYCRDRDYYLRTNSMAMFEKFDCHSLSEYHCSLRLSIVSANRR